MMMAMDTFQEETQVYTLNGELSKEAIIMVVFFREVVVVFIARFACGVKGFSNSLVCINYRIMVRTLFFRCLKAVLLHLH